MELNILGQNVEAEISEDEDDENSTISILTDDGEKKDCDVLCTFEDDETGRAYIMCTDYEKNEDGNTKIYCYWYNSADKEPTDLYPIDSEKEVAMFNDIINELRSNLL